MTGENCQRADRPLPKRPQRGGGAKVPLAERVARLKEEIAVLEGLLR